MTVESLLTLLATALPMMASPGPATIALAATGAAFGFWRGLSYLAGICLGVMSILAAVATGLTGLLFAVPGAMPVIATAAVAYLAYLAWRIATAPVGAAARDVPPPTLAGGLFVAIANPKAFAAMASAFGATSLVPGDPLADGLTKYVVISITIWSVNTTWLGFGAVFAGVLSNERTARMVNIGFAVALVASVAAIVIARLR